MDVVTEKPTQKAVPEGYKRTEVGVIPEKWQVTKLKTIADVKTGPFGSLLHQEDYVENGTPIITVEHLGNYGITTQNLPTVSDEDFKRLRAYRLIEGDIVFSRVGSVDRNSLVSKNEDGWLFSGRLLRIRTINNSISPRYLSHYFSQHSFKERIKEVAVGQTMPSLNTEILNNINVVLPPTLEEQRAIAEALSDVDALIAELDTLIEKKQQVKKGAMQQLLTGKKRLSGFDGEWEEKKLGNITDVIMGSSPSSDNYNNDGYGLPLIGGNADIKNRKSRKRVWTTQIPKKCKKNDVIMTVRAPVGTIAVASAESCLGRGVCALQVNSIDKSFLFYQMMYNEPEWEKLEQGSTFTSANSKQIEDFSIFVPENKEEQKAIARILSDMDAEIQALKSKRDKYQQIKQGMMQELLTGKTRL